MVHFSVKFYFFILFVVACIRQRGATDAAASNSSTLYLLTLLPYPDLVGNLQPSWDEGPEIVPAVQLAVDLINNRTDILPDYRLELIHDDSGCDITSRTYVSFTRGLMDKRSPVGIIGPGCSTASLRTSSLNGRDEIALINVHLSGTPILGNRTKYPNSFGPLGSTYTFVSITFALMKKNNWRRIAALFDESRVFFSSTFNALERDIKTVIPDSEIVFSSAVYNTNFPLQPIKDALIRIITVFTGPEFARRIMCLAYYEKLLFPTFQWILYGREISEFEQDVEFMYDNTKYNCSSRTLVNIALRGTLLINYRYSHTNGTVVTISGLTYKEYMQSYQERIDQYNEDDSNLYVNITTDLDANIAFDAVWALVLALNNSGLDLAQYQFGNAELTNIIREHIYQLDFEGVSGPIKFNNSTGFITRFVNIFQVFNASENLIAYTSDGDLADFSAEIITDSFKTLPFTVKAPLTAIFVAITLTLFGLIVAAHVMTVVYRNYHSLKASSLKLNHLIYIGCYILISGTLLYECYKVIPELSFKVNGNCCQAIWAWLFPISFTLIFGTTTARTWRLYRIFTYYLDPGPLISNPVLFAFIVLLLFCDVVIGTIWTVVDPIHVEIIKRTVSTDSEMGFAVVLLRLCTADYYFVWFALIYGFKALILVAMTALSLLTRNILNQDFTTASLRVLSYLLGLLIFVGGLLYYILVFHYVDINIDYAVLCVVLNILVFLCFALVFLPPLTPLLKEKRRLLACGKLQCSNCKRTSLQNTNFTS